MATADVVAPGHLPLSWSCHNPLDHEHRSWILRTIRAVRAAFAKVYTPRGLKAPRPL